jgi:hypothetical protein
MFKSEPGMDLLKELEWLLNGIRQNGRNAQKTILYMRQLINNFHFTNTHNMTLIICSSANNHTRGICKTHGNAT